MAKYVGSAYKGVRSQDGGNSWVVFFKRHVYLSTFATEELAARMFDRALYLATGDASGPNLGPLTPEERTALDGTTLDAFVAAARAVHVKFSTGSSAYRGVGWNKRTRKWTVRIRVHGKVLSIGYFDDEVAAAKAYDAAAMQHHGAAAQLNFPQGGAAPTAATSAAALDASDSEPDETEADAARLQRWQDKGLLYLAPLPEDDGITFTLRCPAEEEGLPAGADSDASEDADEDGDSDGSDSEEMDEYADPEACAQAVREDMLDGALVDCSALAAAIASDAAVATAPYFVETMRRLHANVALEPVALAEISLKLKEIQDAAAPPPPPMEDDYMLGWVPGAEGPAGQWRPGGLITRSELEALRIPGTMRYMPPMMSEGHLFFDPPVEEENFDPHWPRRPFQLVNGVFRRMRGPIVDVALDEIDLRIVLQYDWLYGTFKVRRRPTTFEAVMLCAEPVGADAHVWRREEVLKLLRRKAAIMDYAGKCRFISRGVTEELPDVLAVISQVEAELETAKAYLAQELEAKAAAAAAAAAAPPPSPPPPPPPPAPPVTYNDWRDIPVPARRRVCLPGHEPAPAAHFVGHLSAEGLAAMLAEEEERHVIELGGEGGDVVRSSTADAIAAAITSGTAALLAEGDAQPLEERIGGADAAAFHQYMHTVMARLTEGANASLESDRVGDLKVSCAATTLLWSEIRAEMGSELMDAFLELHTDTVEARVAEATADAHMLEAEARAEAARREAASFAALARVQEEDRLAAEEAAAAAAAAPEPDVGTVFGADAAEEAALAAAELAACRKRGRVDMPALVAHFRSIVAEANPMVQSCLREVFTGFGEEGTPEAPSVRAMLMHGQGMTREAMAARAAAAAEARCAAGSS